MCETMERADPQVAGGHPEQVLDSGSHLAGGLVRERDRQDAPGRDPPDLDEPSDPVGQDTGLAAAGAGQDEDGLVRRRGDGLALAVVQRIDDGGDVHGSIVPSVAPAFRKATRALLRQVNAQNPRPG
jgi:hypothetical protein